VVVAAPVGGVSLVGQVVDELFVELHYGDKSTAKFGAIWSPVRNRAPREDATALLHRLRANGIYAHAWP